LCDGDFGDGGARLGDHLAHAQLLVSILCRHRFLSLSPRSDRQEGN
jgi:hypothetical protein